MESKKYQITAVVLARNEQERIGDCLKSLDFVHEIIVIDNGSVDETVKLAKNYKATIYINDSKDFSVLRTLGKNKASNDWLLYVDADERVSQSLASEIVEVTENFNPLRGYHGYYIVRTNYYLGKQWPFKDKLIRLIWKPSLDRWQGSLHETAIINGSVGILKNELKHFTHRNLSEMVQKTNIWSEEEACLRVVANHPPVVGWRLIRVFFTAFLNSYIRQGGWKTGSVGIIESIYQGFSLFITYGKLWEKQKNI